MPVKGFILTRTIIVLAIIVLLAIIALPYLGTSERSSVSSVREVLYKLSVAAENYAAAHNGAYPASVSELSVFNASADSYCANSNGAVTACGEYNYACTLSAAGYTFSASPVVAGSGGNTAYTVTTGGVFNPSI